jgi:hypothetical protein
MHLVLRGARPQRGKGAEVEGEAFVQVSMKIRALAGLAAVCRACVRASFVRRVR